MIILFYLLGNTFDHTPNLSDLGLLFYSTSIGLAAIYILFIFNFKTSIHLLSLGVSIGFFLVLSTIYTKDFTVVIIIGLILSGILASSRLYLKAHTPKEIYLGFFLGFIAPIITNYIL